MSIFLSLRARSCSRQSAILLQQFGPLKRCQCRSYSRSPGHNNETANGQKLLSDTSSSSSSSSFTTYAFPAALLGIVGVAGFVRYNDERRAVPKGEGTKEAITVKGPSVGGPFTLINTERQIVTEESLRGNWVLLYFGYTSSPDVGPAELQKMAKAINILESKHNVKLLPTFITIDPQRDSPSQLKTYLSEFDPRIIGLTGPDNSVRQMAQEYRIFFKKVEEDENDYLVDSSHNMYLLSPNLEILKCLGVEYSDTDLVEAIANEVKKSAPN